MRTFQSYVITVAHGLRSAYRYTFGPAIEADVMAMRTGTRLLRGTASVILMINIMTVMPAIIVEAVTPLTVPVRFASLLPLMILSFTGSLPGIVRVTYRDWSTTYAFRPLRAVTRVLWFMMILWMLTLINLVIVEGWRPRSNAQPMEIITGVWDTTLMIAPFFFNMAVFIGAYRVVWAVWKFSIAQPMRRPVDS